MFIVLACHGQVNQIMEDGIGEHYVSEICHLFQENGERICLYGWYIIRIMSLQGETYMQEESPFA